MADGQVLIDSKLDTSGVQKGTQKLSQEFGDLAKATKRTADIMRRELAKVDVDDMADGMSDSFSDEASKIKSILEDTSADAKTKAERIAAVYREAGDDQSTAMRKAWAEVKESSDTGSRRVIKDLDDIGDKAKRTGNEIESSFAKSFSGLATKLSSGLGAIFAADAIFDFGKESIQLGSDLAEVQNVVDVTFGESATVIDDFAKTAIKQFGLSETSAKKFSSTLGAMLKSMGNFSDKEIVEMSTSLAGLAGDMASFYNLDAQEAFDKLRAGISGETEPLKQLGINLSVANLEAFALAEGIKKSYDKMTEQEKALLRYNYILKTTTDAQGDFVRTQDSWANQTRILSESFDALKATIGQGLINVLNPIIAKINDNFMPALQGLADKFAEVTTGFDLSELDLSSVFGDIDFDPIVQSLSAFGKVAGELGGKIKTGLEYAWVNILQPLGEWTIEEGLPALVNGLAGAFDFLSGVLSYLAPFADAIIQDFLIPLGEFAGTVATEAVNLLAGAFSFLGDTAAESSATAAESIVYNYTEAARMTDQGFILPTHEQMLALKDSIVEWFSGAADNIVNDFTTAATTLDNGFIVPTREDMEALGAIIGEAFQTAANTLEEAWRGMGTWVEANVTTPIVQAFEDMKQAAINAWNELAGEITDIWETIKNTARNALTKIQEWIDGLTGKKVNIDIGRGSGGGTGEPTSAYTPTSYAVTPQIPYLATGAVIPPRAPFVAVLGDQPNGVNVEAPLDTIKQAVSEVLSDMGVDVSIAFDGELAQLARVLHPVIEVERRRRGGSLAEVTIV